MPRGAPREKRENKRERVCLRLQAGEITTIIEAGASTFEGEKKNFTLTAKCFEMLRVGVSLSSFPVGDIFVS